MNENRSFASTFWRIALPLLIVAAVLAATVLVSGSALIRIEDITVNRVLAGTYGTPDWRVQEMNPLLAQLLTLLYRIIPSVNWYGMLLLALVAASGAVAIGLAARKKGGLIPAAIIVCPIVLLLTYTVQSSVVCALSAASGALLLMDGLHRRKQGYGRIITGGLLYLFATMFSLYWAILIAAVAAVCWLPCALREGRVKALALGVLTMAVLSLALFGYSALMYNTPELSAYHSNYTLYERLQHSSLKDESQALLSRYGVSIYTEDHADHDHDGDGVPDGEDHVSEDDVIAPNSFDAVGWSINDSSLFFSRYAMDPQLTDPDTLRTLSEEARYIDFTPNRLLGELFTTLKKPQFLMLLGLLVISALAVVITSRRKGLAALLAVLFAIGGHVLSIACYRDAFADIAPFYLVGLLTLLYHFDAEDAKAWYHRVLAPRGLRLGLTCAVLVCFAAAMAGLFYYTNRTPANSNPYTKSAVEFIKPYVAEHPDMLFIGDNPNERYYPDTLTAPVRGEDENLLAGSYDLYSPRAAALMNKYGIENPLVDALNRDDIGYITMSFFDSVSIRLADSYDLYLKPNEELLSYPSYSEMIVRLNAYTQEEVDVLLEEARLEQEQIDLWAEALLEAEEQGWLPAAEDEHTEEDEPAEEATGSQEATEPVTDA